MKITELVTAIGDDNIQFQNLDHSADNLQMVGATTKITFGAEERISVKGTDRLGLVLWLDRNAVADALAKSKAQAEGAKG